MRLTLSPLFFGEQSTFYILSHNKYIVTSTISIHYTTIFHLPVTVLG